MTAADLPPPNIRNRYGFGVKLLSMMLWSAIFHTAILENTLKMCPVICPGIVCFWFIHTASDFPCIHAFTHTTCKDMWRVYKYRFTKLVSDFSFSTDGEELPDLCFIQVYIFLVVNIDLPSKHTVRESHDNARHQPLRHWFWLLFTPSSFRDWTRQCH